MKKLEKVTRFQIQTLPGFWNNTKNHRGTMLSHLNPNSKVSNLSASLVKIQFECNLINFFVGGSKTKELLRRWLKFGQLSSKKSAICFDAVRQFFCKGSNEIRCFQKCLCFQPQTNGLWNPWSAQEKTEKTTSWFDLFE